MRKAFVLCCLLMVWVAPSILWAEQAPDPAPQLELAELFTPAQAEPTFLIKPPVPYCWDVEGTSCPTVGATRSCTDVCRNQLSCTCRLYTLPNGSVVRLWDCLEVC